MESTFYFLYGLYHCMKLRVLTPFSQLQKVFTLNIERISLRIKMNSTGTDAN